MNAFLSTMAFAAGNPVESPSDTECTTTEPIFVYSALSVLLASELIKASFTLYKSLKKNEDVPELKPDYGA